MSDYFKEQYFEERQISKYSQKLDDRDRESLEYLIYVLGDVSLDEGTLKIFLEQFYCCGGRYSVITEEETIKGMFKIVKTFPMLKPYAIREIWFRYIEDLFTECDMISILKKYIELFGQTDMAFEQFILYVETKADEYEKKYKDDVSLLDEYASEYYMDEISDSYQFINHLKYLVKRKHFSVTKIIDCMPSPELVKNDARHLFELSKRYRCYFGTGDPVSYEMTEFLAKDKDLSGFGVRPVYYVSTGDKEVEATFTTDEFIESVQRKKETKELVRKK